MPGSFWFEATENDIRSQRDQRYLDRVAEHLFPTGDVFEAEVPRTWVWQFSRLGL